MKTKITKSGRGRCLAWCALGFSLALGLPMFAPAQGTWTRLANTAPGSVTLLLLLTDGTVMAAHNPSGIFGTDIGREWYRLTPDIHGSYVNGTWSSIASMHNSRLWYSSAILKDGRVFVAGGEYGDGGSTAEVYDPLFDTWTLTPSAGVGFSDSNSKILPDGRMLVSPVSWLPFPTFVSMIYDPNSNTWAPGNASAGYQDEASWVKLPDDTILTIDENSTSSERFVPSTGQWIADAPVTNHLGNPLQLYDMAGEMGAGLLLQNGKVFYLGASGRTALYTPSGNTNRGTWTEGPDIPNGLATPDAPAAMMVNGKILCAVSPPIFKDSSGNNQWAKPTSFFEYDPVLNSFAPVAGPTGPTMDIESYKNVMLALPDGTVLYSHRDNQLYVYQPSGAPLSAGKPGIASVTWNADGSLHITGTLFNGISEGAAYGDDAQMNSNFPLVRLTDGSGDVLYARTFNWSSTGVQTGSRLVSTECSLSPFFGQGWYSLQVVANGISSDPISFYSPVWVDFNYYGFFQAGLFVWPFHTLAQGVSAVIPGGTIAIKTAGSSSETMTITKPMRLVAVGGPAVIGR